MTKIYLGKVIRNVSIFVAIATGCLIALSSSWGAFSDKTPSFGTQRNTRSWGNPIWGDVDNDGDLDLIIPTNDPTDLLDPNPLFYLNTGGNDTFQRIQNGTLDQMSGIVVPSGYGTDWRGFAFGDYNDDGKLDLFVAINSNPDGAFKSNLLFKGNGSPAAGQTYFTQASGGSAFDIEKQEGQAGFWVDADNDGDLELFVKNYFADDNMGANRLYGYSAAVFTNLLTGGNALAQAVYQSSNLDHLYGHGTICSFTDYDNDGDMDVAFSGLRKALYEKTSIGWTERPNPIGPVNLENCKGIAWGDYDNDSDLDLYITTGSLDTGAALGTYLFRNDGAITGFTLVTTAGVNTSQNTWSAVWGDYDNDGFLDLFVTVAGKIAGTDFTENTNRLYRNSGSPNYTFTDKASLELVTLTGNSSPHKTAAWADYNDDGFLDLVVKDGVMGTDQQDYKGIAHLLKNNRTLGANNHFIKVKLDGTFPVAGGSNDHGIGARVIVTYTPPGGLERHPLQVNNGGGGGEYDSQGSEPLHFGLGSATAATIDVQWPTGTHDVKILTMLSEINQTIPITEGCCPPPP